MRLERVYVSHGIHLSSEDGIEPYIRADINDGFRAFGEPHEDWRRLGLISLETLPIDLVRDPIIGPRPQRQNTPVGQRTANSAESMKVTHYQIGSEAESPHCPPHRRRG